MKRFLLLSILLYCLQPQGFSQQNGRPSLIGTWDQSNGKHPATIIFEDHEKVRYSYKGHTGTTRSYYYLLNDAATPSLLTVDYSKSHKKHRNEYLIEFLGANTLKIQVLYKKDSREHFDENKKSQIVLLNRRMDL